jgi:hypothetical protein
MTRLSVALAFVAGLLAASALERLHASLLAQAADAGKQAAEGAIEAARKLSTLPPPEIQRVK